MLTVRAGAASNVGCVREANEDCVGVGERFFVVADGMGGHAAGEVASGLAVERLVRLGERDGLRVGDVRAGVGAANREIVEAARGNPEQAGMGTTVAGLGIVRVAGSDHWVVFNVGDCRVYRLDKGELAQLTVDHNEVEELLAAGRITAGEARDHPMRNVVTRALGTEPAPETDVWVFPPVAGERFLICSDGLPLELLDAEIAEVLRAESDPQRAADRLVDAAVSAGGRDNVTVVVVDHLGVENGPASGNTVPRPG
jgi:PPM family protein phosphatase